MYSERFYYKKISLCIRKREDSKIYKVIQQGGNTGELLFLFHSSVGKANILRNTNAFDIVQNLDWADSTQ